VLASWKGIPQQHGSSGLKLCMGQEGRCLPPSGNFACVLSISVLLRAFVAGSLAMCDFLSYAFARLKTA
jgi:hypothetical protein